MAFRGRGRGRGRFGGGGGFSYARQESFVEFPDIQLPDHKYVKEEKALVFVNSKLQNFWKSSAYYLEDTVSKKSQSMDIERFSDWVKPKNTSKRDQLNHFLLLSSANFPDELVEGAKMEQKRPKKVRWNPDADRKFDFFEKLEQKFQGREDKGEKEKKEGDDDEELDDDEVEGSEEDFSDDDYNQNVDFDDDEDDFNADEVEDEAEM
ncbi:hypothetical protein JCGZ_24846 [Jatropha curcas]|uniref:DNA-directed RNA polymerase III subunit n=1 Tax=Jatropha curcas TaxID=180498 RepID=A0A067KXI5_JATCU|nr:protein PFC0760c [Jatropha curcas]XP_012069065.1 protein PFC0760c [Jatropha curcas]KDP40847.1 hypothetical protein JCGZ_24846 [Jatropha curcas]